MNTRSSRRSKSASIARANSARISVARKRLFVRAGQLGQRSFVACFVERLVVGIYGVTKEADPVALHRVGDDHDWSVTPFDHPAALVPRREQRAEIVSVGGDHVKAEGAQLGVERLERHHLLGATESLDAISIDQPDDVREPAMPDE